MRSLSFTIPGRIGGKGRPRFVRRGQGVAAITPAQTVVYEGIVRQFAALAMKGGAPLEGALQLYIHVWQHRPKSWSAKKCARTSFVTGKPDCDNVAKLIADALNGIAYRDDSQISTLFFRRRYTEAETECVEIQVHVLEQAQ